MTKRYLTAFGLLVALVLGGPWLPARAAPAQTFSKTLQRDVDVGTNTRVRVENLAGFARVSQGGSRFHVTAKVVAGGKDMAAARALADSIRLDVGQDAGQVTVHVNYPVGAHASYQYIPGKSSQSSNHGINVLGMHLNIGHSSSDVDYQGTHVHVYQGDDEGVPVHVDLELQVPAGVNADVVNKVGNMAASGLHGDLRLESASGDILARDINGRLEAHTGSGDLDLAGITGTLDAHSGSGDVTLDDIHGDTGVHTGSGDIKGARIEAASLELEAGSGDVSLSGLGKLARTRVSCGSGDIDLRGDLASMQDFVLRSGSGDITLSTAHPPAVHLDIQGSDIDVDWSGLRNIVRGRRDYRADVGNASGNGRIRSGSGDVTLH